MSTLDDLLSTSTWTQKLPAAHMRTVRSAMSERSVGAGGYLCRTEEAVEHWFGIIEGVVKLGNVSRNGRWVTYTCVTAGAWFGEGSMLKDEPRRFDAMALCDTRFARLPRATFHWLLENSMQFNRFLLHQLNERCSQFISMLEFERTLDCDARVARCLSALFNPQLYPHASPRLGISQEEIANLCGLSRQTVNQALHVLERQGWLRVDSRGITITELRGLQAFASSN